MALNGESSGGILNDVSEGGMSLDILGPRPTPSSVVLNFDLSAVFLFIEIVGQIRLFSGVTMGFMWIHYFRAK